VDEMDFAPGNYGNKWSRELCLSSSYGEMHLRCTALKEPKESEEKKIFHGIFNAAFN